MSFPAYDEYKETGVEWLGEVPQHWNMIRLKHVAEVNPSKSEVNNLNRELPVSFLPMEAIGDAGRLNLEHSRSIGAVESGYTYFREDDVTLAKITPCFENGKGAIMRGLLNGIGFGTTELIVVRPKPGQSTSDYLHWLFLSSYFRRLGESTMYGAGGQKRVSDDFVRNFCVAIPPPEEQASIASFLDVETSKIDGLVSEQRRLTELLKEKRQAVISHAVTKGLNPKAHMKPSGIQWLGDVPEHWKATRAKRVAAVFVPQRNKPELNDSGNGVCWITMEQMQNPEIVDSPLYVSKEASADAGSKVLRSGAVIASCVGQFEVASINRVDVIINQQLQAYIPGADFNPEYLRLLILLSSSYFQQTGTAATIVYVNQKGFDALPVVVPPTREQQEIVDYLDVQLETFSQLQAEAERAIELLQERRTALISAAVTGKIDVREFAYQETA